MTSARGPAAGTGRQSLRRDAERNRSRILAAARAVFAAEGLDASMASVARQAGVGIATIFRHFPAKEDLVAAVFADRLDAYAEAARAALAEVDLLLAVAADLGDLTGADLAQVQGAMTAAREALGG